MEESAEEQADERQAFTEMNNNLVPLALSILGAGAFAVSALIRDDWDAALLRGVTSSERA